MNFFQNTALRPRILWLSVLIMSALSLFSINSALAEEKVYKLTIQAGFPNGDTSVPLLDLFAKSAERRSNGQLQIKWYAAPEIVPQEQLLEAVNMGVLDMQMSIGAYWAGTMPIGDVAFGLPMSYNMPWVEGFEAKANALKDLFFKEGLIEVMREAYAKQGHYYLGVFTAGPVVVLSPKPIKTLDDWKGKKVRTDGQNMAYYETAGAKATSIPGTEAYLALKLGAVDMAEWDISAITGMNWYEVAPYWVVGMESYFIMEFTIGKSVWDKLPDNLKKALEGAYEDYYAASLKLYKKEFETVDELIKQKKVIMSEIDQPSKEFFEKQARVIWDAQAKKDPDSAKAIEIIKKWHDKHSK